MAKAYWSNFGTRSANLAGVVLNSLAINATSATITWTNTNNDLYACVCVELGVFFPAVNGGVTLVRRRTDGTATATVSSPQYYEAIASVNQAHTVIFERVEVMPGVNTFVVINHSEATFPSSGNAFYVTPITEEIL